MSGCAYFGTSHIRITICNGQHPVFLSAFAEKMVDQAGRRLSGAEKNDGLHC
jgi:ribosomal protein L31